MKPKNPSAIMILLAFKIETFRKVSAIIPLKGRHIKEVMEKSPTITPAVEREVPSSTRYLDKMVAVILKEKKFNVLIISMKMKYLFQIFVIALLLSQIY